MLLPYRGRGQFVGGAGTKYIDEECRRREQLKFLALAKDRAILPIHTPPNILQLVAVVRSIDPKADEMLKRRALEQAKEKLAAGLNEWEMIERHMLTFSEVMAKRENFEQWSVTMDEVLELPEVRLHVSNIKRVLDQANMYLAQLNLSAIDSNV